MHRPILFVLLLTLSLLQVKGQAAMDSVRFTELSHVEFPGFEFAYYSRFAPNNNRYVYSTCGPSGLRVYDLVVPSSPQLVASFPRTAFDNLQPDNLEARGNFLYVGLGAHQGNSTGSGLAILNIANPGQPILVSQWDTTAFTKGVAVVRVDGSHAYLGGMEDGLHILDISDPASIQFVSNIVPDTNWKALPFLDPNARGMAVRNDTVFLAYDSGGLRLVDVSNKSQPVEVCKYLGEALTDTAGPAYNHVILHGTKAYLSVDYCGFEIVDFGTPDTILFNSWFNPFGCFLNNWNGRDGHSNEMEWLVPGQLLVASAAKTDLVAVDVSNPLQAQIVGQFGLVNDSAAAWGIALNATRENALVSYVDNTIFPPYYADRGGIALVKVAQISTALSPLQNEISGVQVFPTPIRDAFWVKSRNSMAAAKIRVWDIAGQQVFQTQTRLDSEQAIQLDCKDWPPGIYLLEVSSNRGVSRHKLVRTD